MPESRVPRARLHLVNAALSLFNEAQEGEVPPEVEQAAQHVDEALALLNVQPVDIRLPAPEDWASP